MNIKVISLSIVNPSFISNNYRSTLDVIPFIGSIVVPNRRPISFPSVMIILSMVPSRIVANSDSAKALDRIVGMNRMVRPRMMMHMNMLTTLVVGMCCRWPLASTGRFLVWRLIRVWCRCV